MTAQDFFVSFSYTSITVACASSSVLVPDLNGKFTLQLSGLQVSLSLSLPADFVSGRSVTIDGANSTSFLFVCLVALRPKSTAMVMAGLSVHLTTVFH